MSGRDMLKMLENIKDLDKEIPISSCIVDYKYDEMIDVNVSWKIYDNEVYLVVEED